MRKFLAGFVLGFVLPYVLGALVEIADELDPRLNDPLYGHR